MGRQNNLLLEKDKTQNKLQLKLIEKENQIRDLESKIQRYKKVKSEQNKTNQEKIKLIQIENRSKLLNLKNKNWKDIENLKEDYLKLLEKEKRMNNQKLSRFQELNEKLEFENITLKNQKNILKEMVNNLL